MRPQLFSAPRRGPTSVRHRRLAALALVLLLLPAASAGSERRPDVVDDRGDARGESSDILAGWLEPEEDGLRFTMRVARSELPADYADHIFWLLFTLESGRQVSAIVGYGNDGVLRGHLTTGPDNGGLDGRTDLRRGSIDVFANGGVVELHHARGTPGTIGGLIPWGAYDELEPGATLDDWMFGNTLFERGGRGWTGLADGARADAPFVAAIPPKRLFGDTFPILVPAWVIPTLIVACTALGLAAGYGLARATRRAPAAPAPARDVPIGSAPPAPGSRFQRAPSAKR